MSNTPETTRCDCGKPARFTVEDRRIQPDGSRILVGTFPLCADCATRWRGTLEALGGITTTENRQAPE
jgi:hypothetical protein